MRTRSTRRRKPLGDVKSDPQTGLPTDSCADFQRRPASDSSREANKVRLISLDAFRGLTIALMILVNNHGDTGTVYSPLSHVDWNGWTPADAVFPCFLFIVGVSLVFSFAGRQETPLSSARHAVRVLRRTIILFALGLFVNTYPAFDLSTMRIPGVLQRIAICYLAASLIVLKAGTRGRILWLIGLLVSYCLMMLFIPVPGLGAGVLEPGQNFAAWVDSLLLKGHMWSYYDGKWDPEGIISTIPAIATTLFGVLAGQLLRSSLPDRTKAARMICAGLILLVAGYTLSGWLPINKSLWTSTFSIFMAGLALMCLAFFHSLIDIADLSKWAKPLIILGLNPIAIYVMSIVLDTTLRSMNLAVSEGSPNCPFYLFRTLCLPVATPEIVSLIYGSSNLICMFAVAWILWRRRIFIKV